MTSFLAYRMKIISTLVGVLKLINKLKWKLLKKYTTVTVTSEKTRQASKLNLKHQKSMFWVKTISAVLKRYIKPLVTIRKREQRQAYLRLTRQIVDREKCIV